MISSPISGGNIPGNGRMPNRGDLRYDFKGPRDTASDEDDDRDDDMDRDDDLDGNLSSGGGGDGDPQESGAVRTMAKVEREASNE